jgi:hypothetical protein
VPPPHFAASVSQDMRGAVRGVRGAVRGAVRAAGGAGGARRATAAPSATGATRRQPGRWAQRAVGQDLAKRRLPRRNTVPEEPSSGISVHATSGRAGGVGGSAVERKRPYMVEVPASCTCPLPAAWRTRSRGRHRPSRGRGRPPARRRVRRSKAPEAGLADGEPRLCWALRVAAVMTSPDLAPSPAGPVSWRARRSISLRKAATSWLRGSAAGRPASWPRPLESPGKEAIPSPISPTSMQLRHIDEMLGARSLQ